MLKHFMKYKVLFSTQILEVTDERYDVLEKHKVVEKIETKQVKDA